VVVKRAKRRGATLCDPAEGEDARERAIEKREGKRQVRSENRTCKTDDGD
jgi:hypothetical protein